MDPSSCTFDLYTHIYRNVEAHVGFGTTYLTPHNYTSHKQRHWQLVFLDLAWLTASMVYQLSIPWVRSRPGIADAKLRVYNTQEWADYYDDNYRKDLKRSFDFNLHRIANGCPRNHDRVSA